MNSPGPRYCAVIPCYNHGATVREVVSAAAVHMPVIVIDDGSSDGTSGVLRNTPCAGLLSFDANRGKGAALRAGFEAALRLGFTHAVTLDADGQHDAARLGAFKEGCIENPDAIIVGVRDLKRDGAPGPRRFANRFSNWWFRIETGCRLNDTQCGYRCYPIERTLSLRTRSEGYGYELEILVHACWAGVDLVPLPVTASYDEARTGKSHFRPFIDFAAVSLVHTRLAVQAFCLPKPLRAIMVRGELLALPFSRRLAAVAQHVGKEHTNPPIRLALAVGLGLFCGIAPIWGYQMAAAAFLAHYMKLNKAVAVVASNISFPLAAPFILASGLWLGHLLLYGHSLSFSASGIHERIGDYLLAWMFGSLVLALAAAVIGTVVTLLTVWCIKLLRGLRGDNV